ncbi:hypothetical protein WR25_23687 [Diploscapter pachys]|uniref:Uncharacterized protein n=1 Tax=Diploscapter pachys TaxID=2018661 RepID=A0A2A2KD77_9BILA|nr:hypothetical protein WR25_23687 [Diploscapter pachys]
MFRDPARCVVGNRFGNLHERTRQCLEPIGIDNPACLAHVALSPPLWGEPEASVVSRLIIQTDATQGAAGIVAHADHPVPFPTCCHGRQGDISDIDQRPVFWIRPWDTTIQVANHLPAGEQLLDDGRVL